MAPSCGTELLTTVSGLIRSGAGQALRWSRSAVSFSSHVFASCFANSVFFPLLCFFPRGGCHLHASCLQAAVRWHGLPGSLNSFKSLIRQLVSFPYSLMHPKSLMQNETQQPAGCQAAAAA